MSLRTAGVAVAVRAINGVVENFSRNNVPIFRYAGRKSQPHCEIQWHSSIAINPK